MKITDNDESNIDLVKKLIELKRNSGGHSPGLSELLNLIGVSKIPVDACFLSNPYATEIFMEKLAADFPETKNILNLIEPYPSQMASIAKLLEPYIGVDSDQIIIGNGAIEVIDWFVKYACGNTILLPTPAFSSYIDYSLENQRIIEFPLKSDNDFLIDVNKLIKTAIECKVTSIVLVNPHNPTGAFLSVDEISFILRNISSEINLIVDESFIHFASINGSNDIQSVIHLNKDFQNLFIVKSFSKDFGIAGLRAGYGIAPKEFVSFIRNKHGLWNTNGLAQYFYSCLLDNVFLESYEQSRIKYNFIFKSFGEMLAKRLPIKVYPSSSNFYLVDLKISPQEVDKFVFSLLVNSGVYIRTMSDKPQLNYSSFVRIAGRTHEENIIIVDSIEKELTKFHHKS